MKSKLLIISFVALLVLVPVARFVAVDQAQGQAPVLTDTFDVQDRIFQQRRYSAEISNLQKLYRAQIEVYRDAERKFTVSKGQYAQLDNLNSLEELVKNTHAFYEIRTKVLITYLELMHAVLLETDGVELSLKEQALNNGKETIEELKKHLTDIEQANDRQTLNTVADKFELIYEQTVNRAYFMMSLVSLGNVQQLFDKTVLTQKDLHEKADKADISALSRAEFDRSYAEIDRAVFEVRADLQKMLEDLVEDKDDFEVGNYRNVVTNLDKTYSKVSRVISFVEEANNTLGEN